MLPLPAPAHERNRLRSYPPLQFLEGFVSRFTHRHHLQRYGVHYTAVNRRKVIREA